MADRFTLKRSLGKAEQPRSAAAAAERIAVIIEAAERAAAGVIDDAEKQAQRYMEESQGHVDRLVAERLGALSELTETLAARAEAVKQDADRLIEALGEVRSQLEESDRSSSGRTHLQPVESPAHSESPSVIRSSSNDSPEARLLATQMAISGSSRAEIDACLRNELGVEDPEPLLDAILGLED